MKEKELDKTCSRCRAIFVCHANDIANCQCQQVELTPNSRQFISSHYQDCLCINCLIEISNQQSK